MSAAALNVVGLSAGYLGVGGAGRGGGSSVAGGGGAIRSADRSAQLVLEGLDVELPAGDCLAVVGTSGCGKSTLLHVLAGLLPPLAGSVTVGGDLVAAADWAGSGVGGPGCRAGHAAYMFQSDLLLPWKSAVHNAAFPACFGRDDRRARGEDGGRSRRELRGELEGRAGALLTEFGLGDALDVPPGRLSGGMRQRVALARTMLMDRGLILLDEPFGSLDAVTRAETRRWLLGVMAAHPATWVLVTHDVEEAVLLGDHVAVLHGRPARLTAWADSPLSRCERLVAADVPAGGAGFAVASGCGEPAARLAAAAAVVGRALAAEAAA